jgi:hypothetical protein
MRACSAPELCFADMGRALDAARYKKQIGDNASQPHQGFRKQHKRLHCDPFRVPGLGLGGKMEDTV